MIDVIKVVPDRKLKRFVKRISIFRGKHDLTFQQKLTPSAYTYLSYNIDDIPISIFGNNEIIPDGSLQIAGPKVNEDIWVHYNGRLSQILVEFSASGFYYLFHESPKIVVNKLKGLNHFISQNIYKKIISELEESKSVDSSVNIIQSFLIEYSG